MEALGSGVLSCSPLRRQKLRPWVSKAVAKLHGQGKVKISRRASQLGNPRSPLSPRRLEKLNVKAVGSEHTTTEPVHSPDNLFHVSDKMGPKSETLPKKNVGRGVVLPAEPLTAAELLGLAHGAQGPPCWAVVGTGPGGLGCHEAQLP